MRPSSNRALHAALSGWLVGLLAVGPAAAQSSMPLRLVPRAVPAAAAPAVTVVAIAVDGADRAETARLAHEAEQAVARSGRLALVRLADALDARGRSEREAREAEAAAAMKEGQRAYDELDTQTALQQFDKAVKAYEVADLSRRFGDLIRARVMKAASQVANGENAAAQLEMRAVLALDPRAQFSPNFFPPEQVSFVEKERKAVLTGTRAPLRVSTEPVPAQVYVDGQFRGVSPVDVTDLAPADHYVTVVAPGYAVAQRRTREASTSLTLTPVAAQKSLQTLTERVARKPDGQDRDTALRELGALAGVPQVLALLVRGGTGSAPLEVTALRLDVADGHNLAHALGTVPRGGGLAAGAQTLVEPLVAVDAPRQGGKPVTHFSGGGSRRTLGYVLMATGVALVAGGVYFGMEASAKSDEFKRTPQTSSRAEDLKSTGKTYALVADVGILAGLASAGLGAYFAFAGGGGGGSPPPRARQPEPAPEPAPKATPEPRREALPMPPPPKVAKPAGESLPMPPPPSVKSTPAAQPPPPAKSTPAAEPPPPAEPAAPKSRRAREEEERKRREAEEQRKQEEAEAKRKQEEAEAKRKREEEAKRKREEEERRRREEEEKKKRPALDEDDLRNY